MKYEEYGPLIVNERRSLNAVGEPRLIRPVNILIAVVTNTALIGVSVRGCAYAFVSPVPSDRVKAFESSCTRIPNRASSRSRENDHSMRDADARRPMLEHTESRNMMDTMMAAPGTEFVAWRKIVMKGNSWFRTAAGFPRQKSSAKSIAKPRIQFRRTLTRMDREQQLRHC